MNISPIPVYPEEKLHEDRHPDYLLLLAWTYKGVLLKKLEKYRKLGSKVIVPFPKIEII